MPNTNRPIQIEIQRIRRLACRVSCMHDTRQALADDSSSAADTHDTDPIQAAPASAWRRP